MDINGLYYYNLSSELEQYNNTINYLENENWFPVSSSANSRHVLHYGYKYDYLTSNTNSETDKLPEFLKIYKDKLTDIVLSNNDLLSLENNINENYFNQCIVNKYVNNQGISKHIDNTNYGKIIGCFTINSGCSILFEDKKEKKEIYVEPNSLYIMSKDARYKYTHCIPKRKNDINNGIKIPRGTRYSITFRHVYND